jgi:hypothetical protein
MPEHTHSTPWFKLREVLNVNSGEMQTRTLEVLSGFSALKHGTLKQRVLCDGGNFTLTNSNEFDRMVDELATAGVISRDQRFGWLRLAPGAARKPSQASGRSKTHARLRSGSPAGGP